MLPPRRPLAPALLLLVAQYGCDAPNNAPNSDDAAGSAGAGRRAAGAGNNGAVSVVVGFASAPEASSAALVPPATATGNATATASETASASTAQPALCGFAALEAKFPPEEAWPHGPGVFCGDKTCAAKEACCNEAPTPRCVPADAPGECSYLLHCDEPSDCGTSLYCCLGRIDNYAFKSECATKARCDQFWDRPGGYGLPAEEICARGGSCKSAARTCIPDAKSVVSGGQCVSKSARASCGRAGECPAERPWCLWDEARTQSECIARGPWLGEEGVFECDSRADCPGGTCCSYSGYTRCCASANVSEGLAYAQQVCKKPSDCNPGEVCHLYTKDQPNLLAPGLGTCGVP